MNGNDVEKELREAYGYADDDDASGAVGWAVTVLLMLMLGCLLGAIYLSVTL
jgi:hypothetical protein